MSENWARLHRRALLPLAQDRTLPQWLRVALHGWANARPNGHANMSPGEVAELLGTDVATGEVKRVNPARAIGAAVERGLLAPGSGARCLIVPGHVLDYRPGDRAMHVPCKASHTRAR